MQRIQIRQHASSIIPDNDRVDPIRIQHRLGQSRIDITRERLDDEKPITLGHDYLTVTTAVFCGSTMMCAHGFPGNMIHGPPSTGFSVMPVVFCDAYGM